ncbi:type II toxin-antitoxin system RelE/ParE family toxin [Sphingomonas rubra]|uniref:Plasmid stabilization system protein ParE n=1 Tax=Sphingomonas rubra TaxID=634430 RepID=A0A1I5U4E4_9SPHN|nr:type II toxin-antitoxin system RelE/ParE family toxin [Sphingomonas rubra]SFP90165.1 Plasmid stabilization system protein ParE [Sphingomonas rubra]
MRQVIFLDAAKADVAALDDWIAAKANEDIAAAYLDRLERFAHTLGFFPHRGSPRTVGRRKMRSITFERRYVLLYCVTDHAVQIVRVLDARRDWSGLLPG